MAPSSLNEFVLMPSFYTAALVGSMVLLASQVQGFLDRTQVTPASFSVEEPPADHMAAPARAHLDVAKADDFEMILERSGFDLNNIRGGSDLVPAVYLASLPGDLGSLDQIKRKKQLFFSAVLPLVLRANEKVARERVRLIRFQDRVLDGAQRRPVEREWLLELADRYGLDAEGAEIDSVLFATLLPKVDEIPVSLALAQAAVESGWGASRFARNGNALFGQRAWTEKAGIVPKERASGEKHVVRKYDSLLGSVASYVHNLNSHPSYRDFRLRRAALRTAGRALDGNVLAGGLLSYAEIGQAYVDTLRLVITKNRLSDFDGAVLERSLVTVSG
ncbi:glucosaminidase domain-containing protein [Nisaea sp.]|uniref:glucosaminidase domain-containing protein n=2 Tax=Nisaea sp. TaxID=2024842 RepID=UPI003262E566